MVQFMSLNIFIIYLLYNTFNSFNFHAKFYTIRLGTIHYLFQPMTFQKVKHFD